MVLVNTNSLVKKSYSWTRWNTVTLNVRLLFLGLQIKSNHLDIESLDIESDWQDPYMAQKKICKQANGNNV